MLHRRFPIGFSVVISSISAVAIWPLKAMIRVYQYALSPMLARNCRFVPSCSQYALEALETHGLLRGLWMSVRRIARCHPWHPGGYDPVPPPR